MPMNFTAIQIAGLLDSKAESNPYAVISKLSKIEEGSPKSLAFPLTPPIQSLSLYHSTRYRDHRLEKEIEAIKNNSKNPPA
jgi:hypothetical protein